MVLLSRRPTATIPFAGQRQDGTLEVSADILPLLPAITDYLVNTLILDPNVLRDSTLQRIELMHFIG